MNAGKTDVVVKLSTLLDLANLLPDDQKNYLIQNLLKQNNQTKNIQLPYSIFSTKLSCLETICKYLKEELNLSFNEMSELLNRKQITLRTTYNKTKQKHPKKFSSFDFQINIPINKLTNRKYTTFELLTIYLKENCNLSLNKIAEITNRNYKTIWTTYSRAKSK
ncbi:MAG: hypothetical protein KAQ83_00080 [Nanoarchaeota archaeon]|nr:hypothetical protein [Nanoarchaeota archaeon]